ncbi:hypothetical protein Tco_0456607, partial [Tanacetum coccineum]
QLIRRIHQLDTTYRPFYSEQRIRLTMTKRNDYISITRKNCISNDNEGRMIERNFFEIQGAFLVKIRDNTFNGIIGENEVEHINKFRAAREWFKKDCIDSITTWEDFVENFVQKFYQLFYDNEEIEAEEDDDPNDITDIFKIEGNLFNYETPLTYEEYELNNPLTRDLEEPCSDIDGFCNGGELPRMVWVRSMTYFQDHKWYNELADGTLKKETIMHKSKVEKSWGNATPGHEERRDNPTHEPSVSEIRRFEMMKYSFNADEEYIAIKESKYLNHSKENLDAY